MPTIQRRRISVRTNRKGFTGRRFITPHVKKNEPGQINENTETDVQETPMAGKDEIIPQCEYPFGVSVCISAWKTAEYIEECLDSVAAQTWFLNHDNWEILLGVDGCEETLAKVKDIMHKYKNLKVMMMDRNVGTYVTCNTIMKEAKYEWLLRFDSDDVMYPNMVEVLMEKTLFDKYDLITPFCENSDLRKNHNSLAHGSMLIRNSLFNKFGGYQPWKCAADTEFKVRLKKLIRQNILKSNLFNRRIHSNSLTANKETGMKSKIRKKYHLQTKTADNIENGTIEYITTAFTSIN